MPLSIQDMMQLSNGLFEKNKDRRTPKSPESVNDWVLWLVGEIGEVIDIIKLLYVFGRHSQ